MITSTFSTYFYVLTVQYLWTSLQSSTFAQLLLLGCPVLCYMYILELLGRLPWNYDTSLKMCALRQCRSKNWRPPPKLPVFWGQLFLHLEREIFELHRPKFLKLCQLMGNRWWSFKSYVQKFGCSPKNVGNAKIQKLAYNLAYQGE